MRYYMPTCVLDGQDVVLNNKEIFSKYGKKALIVTGRNSAKINGAQEDVTTVLKALSISYEIFDGVVENPPVSNILEGAKVGRDCDFIIGIGGGSPIDAAKAIGVVLKNMTIGQEASEEIEDAYSVLFEKSMLESLPMIAIPTTAGTGTETTPYAIVTDHKRATKSNFSSRVFPEYALIDVKYFMFMPYKVRKNTCVDALTHLVESYMNTNATVYSEYIALEGIRLWGSVKEALLDENIDNQAMTTFINASTLAGMAISQTGTSLPHGMGYPLTYNHQIEHGRANGLIMKAYLEMCKDCKKVESIMTNLGFDTLDDFGGYIEALLGKLELSDADVLSYSEDMMANAGKLKNHPNTVALEDIKGIYLRSIKGVSGE